MWGGGDSYRDRGESLAGNVKMSKERELLQRLIDAVGDCEDTAAILDIVSEAEELINPVTYPIESVCDSCNMTGKRCPFVASKRRYVKVTACARYMPINGITATELQIKRHTHKYLVLEIEKI